MDNLYDRARAALSAIPRHEFVAGSDLVSTITGHSIPKEETVRHLLSLLPEIGEDEQLIHVAGGSGYLTAVLAGLARSVVYVDRNPAMARAARERFARLGLDNIEVVVADAEQEMPSLAPADLVLCTTFIHNCKGLMGCLREGGRLVCLEGRSGPVPSLALYEKQQGQKVRARTLGWVDFNRTSEQILIDLGMVDEESLASARQEAEKSHTRVVDVIRNRLNLDEVQLYEELARQRGMPFRSADEVLATVDPGLFRRFSRAFLDLSRLIPVSQSDGRITVVTDDPDASTEHLERLEAHSGIECLLVTPTDFRRIWSALDLTARGRKFVAEHSAPEPESLEPRTLGEVPGSRQISPYLVSVYEAILLDAVSEKASDIHIEQYGERVRIRLRVDGELHDLTRYHLTPRELRG